MAAAAVVAAEQRKFQALQALQGKVHDYCQNHLNRLFTYDLQARTQPDIRYSAHAAICKNDLYAIIQLTTGMFIAPDTGPYRMLRTTEPDVSTVSISKEGQEFIRNYKKELAHILDTFDAEVAPAAVLAQDESFPVRRLNLGNSPNTDLSNSDNISPTQRFGGRRKRAKSKRRR